MKSIAKKSVEVLVLIKSDASQVKVDSIQVSFWKHIQVTFGVTFWSNWKAKLSQKLRSILNEKKLCGKVHNNCGNNWKTGTNAHYLSRCQHDI